MKYYRKTGNVGVVIDMCSRPVGATVEEMTVQLQRFKPEKNLHECKKMIVWVLENQDRALTPHGLKVVSNNKQGVHFWTAVKLNASNTGHSETKTETNTESQATTQAPVAVTAPANVSDSSGLDALAVLLAPHIEKRISKVDASEVNAAVQRAIEMMPARKIEITIGDKETVEVGRQHCAFDRVLRYLHATRRVWLVGPAGSGKTTIAENIAKALNLPFYFNGAIDSSYKLQGFIDANGRIIRPAFREAYEKGGVYLFDEVDGSMSSAVLAFNAALANGHADFPDGRVVMHPDFYCIAAANTWGGGATNDYVGRTKQDGAFLDRFVQIAIDYDEELERDICGNSNWARKVQAMRANARKAGIKVIISPRASIYGAKALAAGLPEADVAETTVRKSMTTEQWNIVKQGVI